MLRYVRGQFDPSSKVTVGAAFMSHSVHLPDGTTVKFEIWYPKLHRTNLQCTAHGTGLRDTQTKLLRRDTAGQERYASLAPLYYRSAHIC